MYLIVYTIKKFKRQNIRLHNLIYYKSHLHFITYKSYSYQTNIIHPFPIVNVSFTCFNNKIFLYTKTNPPMYHYSISSHSIKLTEVCKIQIENSLTHFHPPPKITYPCPNIYIRHFNSKYYNCINLTQFHVSVAVHLIFLPFLFYTPFFVLFLFFTQFFLLFLFFTPFNRPFVWIHHFIHHLQLHQ